MKLVGGCLLTAVLVSILRQVNPVFSGLVCAALGLMVLTVVLPEVRNYLETLRSLLMALESDGIYFSTMAKALGIVFVTQTGAQVCRELEAPSVAHHVEFCGRIALLGIAVPVFTELTKMSIEVLR